MNKTFLWAVTVGLSAAAAACGDSGSGGAGGDGSGTQATTAPATGATKATSATATSGATTKASSSATGMAMGPCAAACMGDAGCNANPVNPGMACADCIQAEVDKGSMSSCIIASALGAKCQGAPDCAAMVACVQGGKPASECAAMHQMGFAILRAEYHKACGNCGPGAP